MLQLGLCHKREKAVLMWRLSWRRGVLEDAGAVCAGFHLPLLGPVHALHIIVSSLLLLTYTHIVGTGKWVTITQHSPQALQLRMVCPTCQARAQVVLADQCACSCLPCCSCQIFSAIWVHLQNGGTHRAPLHHTACGSRGGVARPDMHARTEASLARAGTTR